MKPGRSTLSLVMVLCALALGAASGCGPQKKFCPADPNGKCFPPEDAAVDDAAADALGEDRGAIIILD
jgi:hypothetical protein